MRLRAMVCSQAASDPTAGSNVSARFQSARNVSCTTSSANPSIRGQSICRREHRIGVTVVELGQGIVRPSRDLANEGVGIGAPARTVPCHRIRLRAVHWFRIGRLTTSRPPDA